MKFKMNRDFLLQGFGHAIRFEKDIPVSIPPKLRGEARRYGAEEVLEEGEVPTPILSEDEQKAVDTPFATQKDEPQGEDRDRVLMEACEYLVGENDNKKFGANGAPSVTAIKDLVHFRIDATERNNIWEQYNKEKYARAHPSNTTEVADAINLPEAETNTA